MTAGPLLLASFLISVLLLLAMGARGAGSSEDRVVCPAMNGIPGTPGTHGGPGAPGRDGRDGRDGSTGPSGAKGDPGATGVKGLNGEPGPPGKLGPIGQPGPAGPPGIIGEKGIKGESGVGPRSSFSAKIAGYKPGVGSPMLFAAVINNQQEHYNPLTGKFTCAVPGVYFFTFYMNAHGGHVVVMLKKNGRVVTRACGEVPDQMSGSIVMSLVAGDEVWLEMETPYYSLLTDSVREAVFSGFLVFPDLPVVSA